MTPEERSELMAEMEERFLTRQEATKRFDAIDERFDAMERRTDERFDAMEQRTDERFDAMERRTDERFDAMERRTDERFRTTEQHFDQRFDELRRHFDVAVERIVGQNRIFAESLLGHRQDVGGRLAEQDRRIDSLENRLPMSYGNLEDRVTRLEREVFPGNRGGGSEPSR